MQIPKDIRMPEEHQSLWIPGLGTVPTAVLEPRRAVRDYAPDLDLGKDERVGQWVVVVRHGPHEGRPFPVLGLGYDLPPYDEIQRRLYQGDVRKRGYAIVQEIERKNEAVRKDLRDKAHDEEIG